MSNAPDGRVLSSIVPGRTRMTGSVALVVDERLQASLEVLDAQGYELVLLTPDSQALVRRDNRILLLSADGVPVALPAMEVEREGSLSRTFGLGSYGLSAGVVLILILAALALTLVLTQRDRSMLIAPATPTAEATAAFTPPGTGDITSGGIPIDGIGLFVFGGGPSEDLAVASDCERSSLVFWATDDSGRFIAYVPDAPDVVNQAWHAYFPRGIPPATPLIGRCG